MWDIYFAQPVAGLKRGLGGGGGGARQGAGKWKSGARKCSNGIKLVFGPGVW